ncbi:uncharacterized protein K02A2.6-like [Anopheles ziemanni]|uniref:uncharacterized protein K02A2.6-like n=1 Tax=Anopheles coustani TaxID=139045 RepID=UPI002658D1F1|nr:uncharacterized protein K02A2.6-like [Anopheles coustani]XP_058169273.1 uncharacterized protein K02A2.6-like [Anopheles ziemanni]
MQQQHQLFAQLLQQPKSASQPSQPTNSVPSNPEVIMDALSSSITEFRYEAESDVTFGAWFARYEDLFAQDASRLDDAAKVRLLIRKLGPAEYAREGFCNQQNGRRQRRKSKKWNKRTPVETRFVTINVCKVTQARKFVDLLIGNKKVRMQLDTGSDITVVGRSAWDQLGRPTLKPVGVCARTASGSQLQLDGEFTARVTIGDRTKVVVIRVIPAELQLLGADAIEQFQLGSVPMDHFCNAISTEALKWESKFPKMFSGSGLCTKANIQLRLKDNHRSVFCPKRPVAYAMQAIVEKELDRLQDLGVITRTDYSDWAAPIVVVRKQNGSIRICGDYSTGLNSALQSHEYPLPLPEDIFATLAQCQFFSKIDLSDAFLQVEINEQYRPLLTINTHRGLYHYNRLPPGIKIAPAAFQQLMDAMLAGLNRTSGYMDDVVVGGRTEREHDENLLNLFRRIEDYGFTIRAEKCAFKMTQIEYLGFIVDSQGLRPNPEKIAVIHELPAPRNVSEVRSFLGAVNYYGKFVPKMRDLRYPLDVLLKNESQFEWTRECEDAFRKFKEILASDLLLTHYDPNAEIVVSADASSVGLGATISHRFADGSMKVVQHASRALTKAEAGYSQIDREGLAIIFAVKKFHKMLYGRHFRLQTDHRPLLRIFGSNKGIPVYTANRLQRFALQLQLYDFSIEYVKTDQFGNADVLSRLIREHAKPDPEYIIASAELEEDVSSVVINCINLFPLHFRDVAKATESDPVLRQVTKYIMEGWPRDKSYGEDLARFFHRSEALSTFRGSILFGERVVIPRKLQRRCLEQLHEGHPGIQRMKAVARSYVYWPSIDRDIAEYVKTCHACAVASKSSPREKPVSWPATKKPWERIHIDYAGPVDGDYFLVMVDAHTKWPEVVRTCSTTTKATIAMMRGIFARFGYPETLVSDNGPQFVSSEFEDYCCRNGIDHVKTAPFHPQSNGQAERFVDTLKRKMQKIHEGGATREESLDIFLASYRMTPNPVVRNGQTPAEAMLGRKVRTALELLKPPSAEKEAPPVGDKRFGSGDAVYTKMYARNSWRWVPARIVRELGTVMFEVETEDRKVHRRHLNQLRERGAATPINAPSNTVEPNRLPLDLLIDPAPQETRPISPAGQQINTSDTVASPRPVPFVTSRRRQPIQEPRRSSRPRRPPRRLDEYRLN